MPDKVRWEYCGYRIPDNYTRTGDIAEFLNILGKDGWELISHAGGYSASWGIMKRQVQQGNPALPKFRGIRVEMKPVGYKSTLDLRKI